MAYVISTISSSQTFTGATCSAGALSIWVDMSVPDNEVEATSGTWVAACFMGSGASAPKIGGAIGFVNTGSTGSPVWAIDCRRYYTTLKQANIGSLTYTAGNRVQLLMADDGVAGNTMSAYVNGSSVGTSNTVSGTALGNTDYTVGFPTGQFFGADSSRKGTYRRLAFYARKLTSTEASNLNSGAVDPRDVPDLILYRDFDRVTWVAPLPLRDLNPFFNNNTNIYNDVKTGVIGGPLNVSGLSGTTSKYFGLIEVIDENGTNDITLSARFGAATLQGLVESYLNGGAPTWAAVTGSLDETVTTCLIRRTDAAGYYALCHYGNNAGPRKCMVYRCDDWVGSTWTEDQTPAISDGTGSDPDADGVADVVAVQNEDGTIAVLPSGKNIILYRATRDTGPQISICRATKTNGAAWSTLTKTGVVIPYTAVSGGVCPGTAILDAQGRIHMIFSTATPTNGMYYSYSDDEGVTWATVTQVLAPTGTATQPDAYALGDTPATIADVDTLFTIYGAENITDYPGGVFRGRLAAVGPNVKDTSRITRLAKWYYPGTRPYTAVTAAGGALISQTNFVLLIRSRAFRQTRSSQYREVYTEWAAFNITAFVRIEGGAGGNTGKLSIYFRNGGTEFNLYSTATYDDGEWHDWAVVRRSSGGNQFEIWVKTAGAWTLDASSTVNPAVSTTTPNYQALGNWHTTSGEPNEPFRGTIEALCVHGAPPSATQMPAAFEKLLRPVPVVYSGGTLQWDTKTSGTDSGDVYTVESLAADPILEGIAPRMRRAPMPGVLNRTTPPFWPPMRPPMSTVVVTATPVTSTLAVSIESDFAVAGTVSESIPGTLAAAVTDDFAVAATSTLSIPSTLDVSFADDFVVASTAIETIPSTIAASIADDFVPAATSTVANPVDATVAVDITADFVPAITATETIPGTIAAAIADDFSIAITASSANEVTSTVAVDITADFVPALTASESIPATLAVSTESDFTVAATSEVANPVTATVALDISADFAPSLTASEAIPSTLAASIESDFVVAATVSEGIPATIAVAIDSDFSVATTGEVANPVTATVAIAVSDDFTVASTATESIPSTVAVVIADDFSIAASATSAQPVTSTLAVNVADDFVVAVTAQHSVEGDTTIAIAITNDFVIAATASEAIPSTVAVDIAADFGVSVSALLEIQTTGAVEIANDFTPAATASEAIPSTIAISDIASLFVVAATLTAQNDVSGTFACDITADFGVAATVNSILNVSGSLALSIDTEFAVVINALVPLAYSAVRVTTFAVRTKPTSRFS